MKWFIFFLSVCIQFCGLVAMDNQPEQVKLTQLPKKRHSRTQSIIPKAPPSSETEKRLKTLSLKRRPSTQNQSGAHDNPPL